MSEKIALRNYTVTAGKGALRALPAFLDERAFSRIVVLADTNTVRDCLPLMLDRGLFPHLVVVEAGETHKDLDSCARVWQALTDLRCDREALLLALGGGMICDLGGYAAACYKRGIACVYVPTTLLAQADAAIGGKTGIDFAGYKNQVGLFREPLAVFADPAFFGTLPGRELLSGYAEVLKHLLIADKAGWEALPPDGALPDDWAPVVTKAIRIKAAITEEDPLEKGPRKALNFGHTVGHAVESMFLRQPPSRHLRHGEAVAVGMLCEAWLSARRGLLDEAALGAVRKTLLSIFGKVDIPVSAHAEIAALALQDKKNASGRIRCTLLDGIGGYRTDVPVEEGELAESLEWYGRAGL